MRTNRLHLERLERRELMAGDVDAVLQNGNLILNEAAGQAGLDNAAVISQLPSGLIRVAGASTADGTQSLINGAAFRDFLVPGDLQVHFGGGNDGLELAGLGSAIRFRNVELELGTALATGDTDRDRLSLANLETTGGLSAFTGAGNDFVFFSGVQVGDGVGHDNCWIYTGAGADTVNLEGATRVGGYLEIQTYDSSAEADVDWVLFDQNVWIKGNAYVRTGGGGDEFHAGADTFQESALQVDGSLFLETGAGSDRVALATVLVGNLPDATLSIRTGAGADSVDIDQDWGRSFFANLEVQTYDSTAEIDADLLRMQKTSVGNLTVRLGGGDDRFFITDPADTAITFGIDVGGTAFVDAGAGHDWVHVEGTTVGYSSGPHDLVIQTARARTR